MKSITPTPKSEAPSCPPQVDIIMGSNSDWPTMKLAADACAEFGVPYEARVVSAHRTPMDMAQYQYGRGAAARGLKVIIPGAGGAAHLPGMVASHTPLPVIGVPIETKALKGLDSLLSIAQMPAGVPVATVAIGGGRNAGLLAVPIPGGSDPRLREQMLKYKARLAAESRAKNGRMTAETSSCGKA